VTSPFEIAYGQNAEDVVLRRALKDVDKGFYVEVGGNDPTVLSISRAFYDAGWRGIVIEPVESLAERFAQDRPRDLVVQAAITAADVDEVALHAIDGTGLSTLDNAISDRHAEAGYESREVRVPARSLNSVLDADDVPEAIHFMIVDTEGTEADVLASLDLTRWRPWILVVEATEPLTNTPSHQSWEPALLASGYEFCLFDGISRFYVAAEHAGRLKHALSYPPNVLDNYTPHHWHRREQEFAATSRELAQLRTAHNEVLEQLIRWRGTVLERWTNAVESHGGSPGPASHEVVRLREELAATQATVSWRVTAPLRAVQERRLRGWR
jgi:FkbM family methyltransferase